MKRFLEILDIIKDVVIVSLMLCLVFVIFPISGLLAILCKCLGDFGNRKFNDLNDIIQY